MEHTYVKGSTVQSISQQYLKKPDLQKLNSDLPNCKARKILQQRARLGVGRLNDPNFLNLPLCV